MLTSLIALALLAAPFPPATLPPPVPLIFDTDLGNDVDDALALGVIHALERRGECRLIAVTLTKDHPLSAPFVDAVNTFYGNGNVPIGVVREGATPQDSKYTALADARDGEGLRYPHDLIRGADAPDATRLLRETLARTEDKSVLIVQAGFSTNLARLLDSPPDDLSPLSGRELAALKVKLVSAMAGAFTLHEGKPLAEYNVVEDLRSAQKFVRDWPTPIVFSGFEVGITATLPAASMKFEYRHRQPHILEEAYRSYHAAYTDQPSWDLTSVLWAVRPERGYFDVSQPGRVSFDEAGLTRFTAEENGPHRYLIVSAEQAARVSEALAVLASEPH